ncbi:hypothetical protein PYW08_012011 [Mythimna loreyi]|uniref:Uncharacterized protein n=1 Tax=Mythimna loreyi TaxID=667449 RepID=A0ACC2QL19_9NEOP|nr:hypothetical protein PYW08_012011 [Mythimna loreyi]
MAKKIGQFLGVNEIRDKEFLKQLFSEFLGTFIYLAIVLSAGLAYGKDKAYLALLVAWANGFIIATIVQIFGHVSGGHVNPAVTVGALVCARIKPFKAVCYIIMHVLGSIAGARVAYAISAEMIREQLGATVPFEHSTRGQIFAWEFLMTFLLVAVVLSVTDYDRGARGLGSSSLAIGICITGCISASHPYTGSLNPVRSLGPAVVMGVYNSHCIYWAGPLLGGLVAGLVYRFVLGVNRRENSLEEE